MIIESGLFYQIDQILKLIKLILIFEFQQKLQQSQ